MKLSIYKLSRPIITALLLCAMVTGLRAEDNLATDDSVVTLSPFQVEDDKHKQEVSDQLSSSRRLGDFTNTVPRSVVVVDRLRIEERGALSIQDTLRYTPSVLAGPYGFDSRLDSARIRGIEPLKFQDGFQSLFGFYNNTRADIYTLEQIEAVKGPASVIYGRGALGGIVNVVSKLPRAETRREIELQYGSHNRRQVSADFMGVIDESKHWFYRVVGVYRDSDTQVDYVPDDARVISPSLTWAPREGTRVTVLGNFQENQGGQSLQFLPNEGALLPGRKISVNTFIGESGWDRYDTEQKSYAAFFEHALNDTFSITSNARYTEGSSDYKSHWVAYDGSDPLIAADGTINRTIYDAPSSSEAFVTYSTLAAKFDTGPLSHRLTIGFDSQDVTTDTDSYYGFAAGGRINIYEPVYGNLEPRGPIFDSPSSITKQWALFVQDRITWDQWTVALGLRYDDVRTHTAGNATPNIDDTATTHDMGIIYEGPHGLSPYISWAESFEPLGTTRGLNGSVLQLDPKTGTQYEIGLRYQPVGTRTLFTIAAFDITEKERPFANGAFVTQKNVDTRGIELEIDSRWRDLRFQGGYSYLDARDGNDFHIITVPTSQAVAWLTYEPSEGALENSRIGFGVRHNGRRWDGIDKYSADPYTLLDFMVAHDFERVRVQLNVNNLADKYYVATTDGGRSYFGAERNITLIAKYRF